jgi:cytochrome c biogenesis protein CcdA
MDELLSVCRTLQEKYTKQLNFTLHTAGFFSLLKILSAFIGQKYNSNIKLVRVIIKVTIIIVIIGTLHIQI